MIRRQRMYALFLHRFEDFFTSFFATNIIKGASLAASRLEADILLHIFDDLNKFMTEEWPFIPSLNPPYIDGIIFGDVNGHRSCLDVVAAKGVPFIVLNNNFAESINCVSINNRDATRQLTESLIALGHEKIAIINGNLRTHAGFERLAGFKDALKAHNINVPGSYIKNGEFLRSLSRIAAEELLKLKDRPTAIFAASDVMAMEAIDVIRLNNLKVPEDISVFGFDNFPLNIYSKISLSTVSQPLEEMGRLGVEALNQIVSKQIKPPFKRELQAQVMQRDSCAKLI